MEYSISALSNIAGISTRALRYYDQIGLLRPSHVLPSRYRKYGSNDVDRLQQILLYKEMGLTLGEIAKVIDGSQFDVDVALSSHLEQLEKRKTHIEVLIETLKKTQASLKGEEIMKDSEKFEGFKKKMITENEEKYGVEVREKYGEETVEASNQKFKGMTQAQYERSEVLSAKISENLLAAIAISDPACAEAQEAADCHRQWLCIFWPDGMYNKDAHKGLAQMYCDDERFKAYYEKIAPGCAEFLRDAVNIYCS